jgi:hypothetical protein
MRWGLVGLTALIAMVVFVWLLRERKLGEILPLGLILGGALGNIRDHLQRRRRGDLDRGGDYPCPRAVHARETASPAGHERRPARRTRGGPIRGDI